MNDLLTASLVILAAGFVQGGVGFGFGLVSMSVLPLLMGLRTAVPLVALVALVVSGAMLWRYRRGVELRLLAPLAAGVVLGVPVGVSMLKSVDPEVLTSVLGVILIGYAASQLRSRKVDVPDRAPCPVGGVAVRGMAAWGVAAGVAGGMLGGAFNTGGPPVILYATVSRWKQDTFKGVVSALFTLSTVLQIGLLSWTGLVTRDSLGLAGVLLPVMGLGVWVGMGTSSRLDQAAFRRWVLVAVLVLGTNFVARAVWNAVGG